MTDLHFKTITELASELQAGRTTSVDIVQGVIDQTVAVDGQVKAFLSYDAEDALAQARVSDKRRAASQSLGPLDGIPVGIKDNIAVKNQPLGCASRMLEGYVSPFDATCIERLRQSGAVIHGRLNMDEFAMGSSTENSAYHTTANPWDPERIPGGSSGGSAAAVAAGEVIAALGSDTGGSIRQPAAFCGIVGMKPTYGLISRHGLVAFASSLDQIGPFARTVEDAAVLMEAMLGKDPLDSTSIETESEASYVVALKERKGPWKLGVPREFFGEGLDPEVKHLMEKAIAWYQGQGCQMIDISLPHSDLAVPIYYILATAEASSNLARFDGVRYGYRHPEADDIVSLFKKSRGQGFGEEVKRRILLGTYVLSSGYCDAYYLRAQKVRTLIRNDFEKSFKQVDAILTPTSPTPAFKRGARSDDLLAMYLSDIYTISVNLAGLPAISIPGGFTGNGLPVGLQLIGKAFGEADLFAIAHAFEQAHEKDKRKPVL